MGGSSSRTVEGCPGFRTSHCPGSRSRRPVAPAASRPGHCTAGDALGSCARLAEPGSGLWLHLLNASCLTRCPQSAHRWERVPAVSGETPHRSPTKSRVSVAMSQGPAIWKRSAGSRRNGSWMIWAILPAPITPTRTRPSGDRVVNSVTPCHGGRHSHPRGCASLRHRSRAVSIVTLGHAVRHGQGRSECRPLSIAPMGRRTCRAGGRQQAQEVRVRSGRSGIVDSAKAR